MGVDCTRPSIWIPSCPACIFILVESDSSEEPTNAEMPRVEQMVGQQLRLLRQSRKWSQQEVADRMKPFGYNNWRQSTIGKIEAAQRPLRLDELVDLAVLFEVPAAQFLEVIGAGFEWDDPETVEREIEHLSVERDLVRERLDEAKAVLASAEDHMSVLRADLARIDGRLDVLARWHPAARRARKSAEGGGRR
jgi:transcriptional regulator with XRE-family HTH domain